MRDNPTSPLRIPPATRATDTTEIPRYKEDGVRDDNWGKATGRIPDDEFMEASDRLAPNEIKQRQVAYMTAAIMWFFVLSGIGIAGSFVAKLIGYILGA